MSQPTSNIVDLVRSRTVTLMPHILFVGITALFAARAEAATETTVAISVPAATKVCGRMLPRLIATELERFGVHAIYGKAVAEARRKSRVRNFGSGASAAAALGRVLEAPYVLHVITKPGGGECRARAVLVESETGRVYWSSETRYALDAAEAPIRKFAGMAMLDLFAQKPKVSREKTPVLAQKKVERIEPRERIELSERVELKPAVHRVAVAPKKEPALEVADTAPEPEVPEEPVAQPISHSMQSSGVESMSLSPDIIEAQVEDAPLDEGSSLQLRGLLSVANALEHQPALQSFDFKRKRAHAFATFRGMATYEVSQSVEVEAHALQTLAINTDDFSPFPAAYDEIPNTNRFAALDYQLADGQNASARIGVDRLNVRFSVPHLDVTIGRQPINLATTYYFTPNDFFMPFSADTVYRGYKPGVDAARFDVQLGELSTVSLLAVAGYERELGAESNAYDPVTWDRSAILLTSSFSLSNFHVTALAGKAPSAMAFGGAIEGELFEWLGVRAEGHYAVPTDGRKNRVELAFGLEHRFENSLHLRVEQFLHGAGRSPRALGSSLDQGLGTIAYLSRSLTAFGVGYEVTAMFKVDGLVMVSLGDSSGAASLSATYSIFENGEVAATGRVPWGLSPEAMLTDDGGVTVRLRSELGSVPIAGNVDFRVFF
jgi:hypothetical protein